MTKWFGTAALLAVMGASPLASAAMITANADTFVQQNAPTGNNGASTTFAVKNDQGTTSSTTDRIGFLQFDVTGSPTPVTSATLVFNITSSGTTQTGSLPLTFSVLGIPESLTYGSPAIPLESFVEGNGGTDNNPTNELTFGNTPGATSTSTVNGSFTRTAYTLLGQFTSTAAASQISFSTSQLIDFLNADTNGVIGLVIVRDTDDANATTFASRETITSSAPRLFINQPVPEPGTLGLAAMGAFMALTARRRKPQA